MKYLILIGIVLTIGGMYFWDLAMVRIASKPVPQPPSPNTGRRTYANGRPTMPSEVESTVEFKRRRCRNSNLSPHLSECECWGPTLRDTGGD